MMMENNRLFCRTGEVTALLDLEPHVLRYWESRFPKVVRPIRRSDGRRLYRPEDVAALTAIKRLVRSQGLTLKAAGKLINAYGVEKILENGSRDGLGLWFTDQPHTKDAVKSVIDPINNAPAKSDNFDGRLCKTLSKLEDIKARIDGTKVIETGRVAA